MEEEWFTLDDIAPSSNDDRLFCISVDSPEKQFLAGKTAFPTHNSEQGKAEDELKGEASMIIGSIARLGRAAGVHLVIATQRPDAKIIAGETKANLGVRINCGQTGSTASMMILDSGDGTRVKSYPRGRLYLKIFSEGDHGQGFFASPDWIDKYLASKGLNPDGTPITSSPRSQLAHVADLSQLEGDDLDTTEGVDNTAVIERIREEEAVGHYTDEDIDAMLADDDDDDDDYSIADDDYPVADDDYSVADDDYPVGDDDYPVAPTTPAAPPEDRPDLSTSNDDSVPPWYRPEDDWDPMLDDLQSENFDQEDDE